MRTDNWQRRWHPLLEEWVMISTNTQSRPISQGLEENMKVASEGESERKQQHSEEEQDEKCYLCPNNIRASNKTNPDYEQSFVFENDYPALAMHAPEPNTSTRIKKQFEQSKHLKGECRVVCFDPKHNTGLADLDQEKIVSVFQTLQSQFYELSQNPVIENILMFENKGKETGASNPHPHGQIYATPFIPKNIETHLHSYQKHLKNNRQCLMSDLVRHEKDNERLLIENEHFIAIVPLFARFAYETIIIPKQHRSSMKKYSAHELNSLAEIYKQLMQGYDKLFNITFPNIIYWINSPLKAGKIYDEFHCYLSFCTPLRSATQVKFLAAF